VYVGESEWPTDRVRRHRLSPWKAFDSVVYLPVAKADLPSVERHWILRIRPVHNRVFNPTFDPSKHACWGDGSPIPPAAAKPWSGDKTVVVALSRRLWDHLARHCPADTAVSDYLHSLLWPGKPPAD
jgi:hypothetical protein